MNDYETQIEAVRCSLCGQEPADGKWRPARQSDP